MSKLAELQERKNKLATEIKERADTFNEGGQKWADDEARTTWETVNADYDKVVAEIDEARNADAVAARLQQITDDENRSPELPPGLEDTGSQRRIGGDDGERITDEHRGLALAGWILGNRANERHRDAAKRCKLDLLNGELRLDLGHTDYTRAAQREWRSVHGSRAFGHTERALSALDATKGGVTVPSSLVQNLELNMLAFGGIRQVADTIVTASGERMTWPTADDTGNTGEMLGESGSIGASTDPSFAGVAWDAYKFSSKPILVPYELLEDSAFDLPSRLGQMLGERLGRITATKHTTGTGANEPKGIVTAATLGVTAASATAITTDEILDLVYSVDPAYRNGAGFAFHDNVLLYLRKLKDGDNQYLWQPGMQANVPDRLFNYDYTVSMEMASSVATTNKTVLFGQLSKHKIRRVRSVRFYRLTERYRDNDQDGFVAFLREDSNLLDAGTAPVKYLQQA